MYFNNFTPTKEGNMENQVILECVRRELDGDLKL